MPSPRSALVPVACLALAFTAGCGSSSDSGDPAAQPTAGRTLHPTTCGFAVRARPEAIDVYLPKKDADTAAERTSKEPGITRIRLGLGGTVTHGDPGYADPSTSMAFAWDTDLETNATTVQYGATPDPATWTSSVDGMSYVIPAGEYLINATDRRTHEAFVCGLTPDTTYYYRVGGGPKGAEAWSEVRSFRTLPSSTDAPLVVAVTGDSRGEIANAWQILQSRLAARGDVQLQLFSGDLVVLGSDQKAYEQWVAHGSDDAGGKPSALASILTLVAMGNHENYQAPFFTTVVQPDDPALEGQSELFFSFDAGPAHFVVLDDFGVASPTTRPGYRELALAWLEKDLAKANERRTDRPFIVAVHHHGEWSSAKHGDESSAKNVRKDLVPLWDKHGVDLVLDGHDHNYERSKPLTLTGGDPTVDPSLGKGTVYVVCAGSGAEGYGNGKSMFTETSFSYKDKGTLGVYGILTLTKKKLSFEARSLTAAGTDPIEDSFTIEKP